MLLVGIGLALFFFVEWLLTFATVFQNPVWIPPQWLVHIVYWVMILLVLVGGYQARTKK